LSTLDELRTAEELDRRMNSVLKKIHRSTVNTYREIDLKNDKLVQANAEIRKRDRLIAIYEKGKERSVILAQRQHVGLAEFPEEV